jgi:MoaD family protein
MIKVKAIFMSILGELIGMKEADIELPDYSTFKDLMKIIKEKYGPKFPKELFKRSAGEFQYMHLMLNMKDIYEKKDGDRPLADGDVLYFIPPIGGG